MNKLKPYKYMESKIQKQEQQMSLYWEQSASGVHTKNFDTKEDEDFEMQKPQMWNTKEENPTVNTILIFNLQMNNKFVNNNPKSEGFGMQRSKDDLS